MAKTAIDASDELVPATGEPILIILSTTGQKFSPGELFTTPGVQEQIPAPIVAQSLARHLVGDWGELDGEDKAENEMSLENGFRLLSAYYAGGVKFWIITEADRSATTVLLPSEY